MNRLFFIFRNEPGVIMFLRTLYYALIGFLLLPASTVSAQSHRALKSDVNSSASLTQPSIGTKSYPDFFVVNSIHCPQKSNGCIPQCKEVIHRYQQDRSYHPTDMNSLVASLKPGIPVCIIVHGSFVKTKEFYTQSVNHYQRILASANDRPLHLIAVHWPSDPGLLITPIQQVRQLGNRAEYNGIYLARLITRIPPDNPVSLVGHSHGCRVIASALHLLGGGPIQGVVVENPFPQRRMRAVFGAGAVEQNWLNPGQRYGNAFNRIEFLLNIKNRRDSVLKLYTLTEPYRPHTLGQNGFRIQDLALINTQAGKIIEYDVSNMVGTGHMISHYAAHPQIRATYLPFVYFD